MCELLGLSFRHPISADFSLRAFEERDEENPDGWGLAWYPDQSLAIVKEPREWGASKHSDFLEAYHDLRSKIYVGHVRHRTAGGIPTHADTHPFAREWYGREYCFAHNGTLRAFRDMSLGRFRPIGYTDSEWLFCHLLEELARAGGTLESPTVWPWLHQKLQVLNRMGKLNCLFSDGRYLACYHDAAGFKGLSFRKVLITDHQTRSFGDPEVHFALESTSVNQGFVVASRPLSPTGWGNFHAGELAVFTDGILVYASHRDGTAPHAKTRLDNRTRLHA